MVMMMIRQVCCSSRHPPRAFLPRGAANQRRTLFSSQVLLVSSQQQRRRYANSTTTTTGEERRAAILLQQQSNNSSTIRHGRARTFASSLPQPEFLGAETDSEAAAAAAATADAVHVTRTKSPPPPPRPRLTELRARLQTESATTESDGGGGGAQERHAPRLLPRTRHPTDTGGGEPNSSSMNELRSRLARLPDPPPAAAAVLTDRFQRRHTYLRLSVTERCNLRCTYCMPARGVPLQPSAQLLTTKELLVLARHFARRGVTKFRLTGGEPTLRGDLLAVVDGLKQLGPQSIGMTTNGIALGGGSGRLQALVEAGLTGLNVSLDTLDAAEFAALTRRPASYLPRVLRCLEEAVGIANDSSNSNNKFVVKLNCVVLRGTNDHRVADFVRLARDHPGLQVRFIEYMPFTDNGWNGDRCVPYRELLRRLRTEDGIDLHPLPADDPHDTTKWFACDNGGDNNNTSKIGFITSMSEHFCGTCNRLRLTADGQIKVCLFGGSGADVSLRDALRAGFSARELDRLIHAAVQTKRAALGGHRDPADIMRDAANNRPMTLIGG